MEDSIECILGVQKVRRGRTKDRRENNDFHGTKYWQTSKPKHVSLKIGRFPKIFCFDQWFALLSSDGFSKKKGVDGHKDSSDDGDRTESLKLSKDNWQQLQRNKNEKSTFSYQSCVSDVTFSFVFICLNSQSSDS